jgi:hypothetical protein
MKDLFISLFCIFSVNLLFAQITFKKTYGGASGDAAFSAKQTIDGGYILAGLTTSFGAGQNDIYIIKTDSFGDLLWTKTFGSSVYEGASEVQQTTDGGYIIAGGGEVGLGAYLIRIDSIGGPLWTKIYSISGATCGASSVKQTADGGFIFAGVIDSNSGTGVPPYYPFLLKTDFNGNLVWTKIFSDQDSQPVDVHQTIDGEYILSGSYYNQLTGHDDFYLIKTDTIGNLVWAKTYGGTGDDICLSSKQTSDGGYILAGVTTSFGWGGVDVYLVKTDANGDTLWTKTLGTGNYENATCIQQTTDNGYIITGNSGSNAYLLKTDTVGNPLWSKLFSTSQDNPRSVGQTTDGGYMLAGYAEIVVWVDGLYLTKTDSLGNSGCNEINMLTLTSSPATQVTTPVVTVTSGGNINPLLLQWGNGGTVTTLCASVGIQSAIPNPKSVITISPNPSDEFAIINLEFKFGDEINVIDMLGKTIFRKTVEPPTSNFQLQTSNFPNGIYFVKINNGEKVYGRKMVVSH